MIANQYYEMSLQEMEHYNKLCNMANTLLNEMRTSGETFNTSIEIIYNYEHEKAIDEATEVKFLQEMYKK